MMTAIRMLFKLLAFFIGDQLKQLLWLFLFTLPLMFIKEFFVKRIVPWLVLVATVIGAAIFWLT